MERIGTAITSTLGVLILSVFAASPEPIPSDTPSSQSAILSEFQDDMDNLTEELDRTQAKSDQIAEGISLQLGEVQKLLKEVKDSRSDKVPDFNDLPDFDSGGSDGATVTPGWEAGTISNSGSGSSGGSVSHYARVLTSGSCPCGSNCSCASVSMVSAPGYSGGSSGSYSGYQSGIRQPGPMQRLNQRITQQFSQSPPVVQRTTVFPLVDRPVLLPRRRANASTPVLDCSTGTCRLQ